MILVWKFYENLFTLTENKYRPYNRAPVGLNRILGLISIYHINYFCCHLAPSFARNNKRIKISRFINVCYFCDNNLTDYDGMSGVNSALPQDCYLSIKERLQSQMQVFWIEIWNYNEEI